MQLPLSSQAHTAIIKTMSVLTDSPISIHEIEAKSGLSRSRLPEAFLVSLYRAPAPYRGCAHGCLYCDGRAEKYYVDGVFDRDIAVRTGLAERIRSDVSAAYTAREYGAVAIGSGVTDVYQPLEEEQGLTRKCLEQLAKTALPIVILTKNKRIQRDFDLLAQFPSTLIITTITTVNEVDAGRLEPGASSAAERLELIKAAKKSGFNAGIMAMPLCPGISDSDESFTALLDAATAAGADFVYPGGLTLRPGRQKEVFFSLLDQHYPQLRSDYEYLYGENRQSGMPISSASRSLNARLDRLLRKRKIPGLIPHSLYRSLLSAPDALFVLYCHMQKLYALRAVDVRSLEKATDRYGAWLAAERTKLRRKRLPVLPSDPFPVTRILCEKLNELCEAPAAKESLDTVLGNKRLAALSREIILKNKVFDYSDLCLGDPGNVD